MRMDARMILKSVGLETAILNLLSAGLGIAYGIVPSYTVVWDVFGVLLIVAIFSNLGLIYLLDRCLVKTTARGKRLNKLSYWFLFFSGVTAILIPLANFLLSVTYSNQGLEVGALYTLLYFSNFGLLTFGAIIGYSAFRYSQTGQFRGEIEAKPTPEGSLEGLLKRLLVYLVILFNFTFLILGAYFSFLTLAAADSHAIVGHSLGRLNGTFGIFVSMFGASWAIGVLGATLTFLKLTRRYHHPKLFRGIGLAGIVMTCILFLPMLVVPASTSDADSSFATAFGANWQSRINPTVEVYFLKTRFTIPQYFLGIPAKDCIVKKDVLFYEGVGVDAGIDLYFDAFLPPNSGVGMPGQNSTIIRIHGGAWVFGDKGWGDMMQINKYFAAQGYCVFDVQYGLNNATQSFLEGVNFLTPANVQGNFTVNDMLRHLGLFCNFLATHQADYGANLSSVFVSGGSAGGHLTCALALGIASGNYTTLLGSQLTLRGLIPFYPANGHAGFDTTTEAKLIDPALLVNASSPPCLIFQGTQDGLVTPDISQALKDAYTNAGNPACALIWLPLGGHAADIYFSGPYNQFFLYYMERFLYLFR